MLRTRILAAATAALLMLGMSVGGAGAAFAVESPPADTDTGTIGTAAVQNAKTWENCQERPATPEIAERSRLDYQRYSWTGGNTDGFTPTEVPPGPNWNPDNARKDQGAHRDAPVGQPFQQGGGENAAWFYWTETKVIEQAYVPASPAVTCDYEVGLYIYKKLNPNAPAAWANSGPQRFIASQDGKDWFTTFPADLPADVCGPGWAVQQDKVRISGTFNWPSTLQYPNDIIGWPPIYAAKHNDLTAANYPGIVVPACPPVEIEECETPNPVTQISNLDGLYFETRSGGSQVLGENGIEIATFGADLTQAKSAGYVGLVPPIPFGEIGSPSMDYTVTSGESAGLNVTLTKNGAWFGNLVFEPLFDQWWINKAVPGMPAGPNPEYQLAYGSLDEFYAKFIAAGWTVDAVAIGYSLGSGAIGSGIVRSLVIGCDTYTFALPPVEPPTLGVIPASASSVAMTCDVRTGSYTFGATGPDAGKIVWTVNGQPATPPAQPIAVSTTTTIVITAQVDPQFPNFGINPSGSPTVNQQTGVYTWTFEFRVPTSVDCPTVIPVVDPFDFLDSCLLGQSYTLEFVEGITYWVTVDPAGDEGPRAPFAVVFAPNETVATLIPQPGDSVSVMPVADPGYVLAENQPKPFSHTFAVYGPNDCQLTNLPNWPASVSSTNETCTPLATTSGVITVQLSTGSAENPNPVRYYLAFGTPQQVELTSATTAVAPGTYVVTAQAFLPADSVNNSGRTVTFPALTVNAADVDDCDLDTLAFTGAGEITQGLGVLAVLLTLAGMGFVLRRHRVEV